MPKVEVDSDLKEILPNFLSNREKDVISLREYIQNSDWRALEKLGHKVSGSSGGYGFSELGTIAKSIENCAKAEDMEGVRTLVDQFEEFIKNVEIEYV